MSNMVWNDDLDDEKPWESDKFTAMDELAYEAGIDTAPDKGVNHDKEFVVRMEKAEFLRSTEGRMKRLETIADHMDYTELKRGKMSVEGEDNCIHAQGHYKSHYTAVKTHGQFVGNLNDEENAYIDDKLNNKNNNGYDSDDDLFKDDDDDDDLQRQMELIRAQRINQMKQQALQTGTSIHAHERRELLADVNPNQRTLNCLNGVREIIPEEFTREVQEGSKNVTTLMLVYKYNNRPSEIMLSCLNQMAARQRSIRIFVIVYSSALAHVPESHCPILMCYQKEKVVGTFSKLDHFQGSKTTALDIEWKLAECGIIDTDLQEDPREAALFD